MSITWGLPPENIEVIKGAKTASVGQLHFVESLIQAKPEIVTPSTPITPKQPKGRKH